MYAKARRAQKAPLGEFEQQVVAAVKDCEPEAYGVRVCEHLLELHGGSLALAQVYVTLNRLERKGFLSSHWTDPKPIPGGRSRRIFKLDGKGVMALEQSIASRERALASSRRGEGTGEKRQVLGKAAIVPAIAEHIG
jgi:PadR family transcriptional regulator, regulatory protein PadR